MHQEPLISIIIPTYNRADLLLETLNTIKQQSYKNWECIIVDDHSTDNTLEVLEAYIKKNKQFSFFERSLSLSKGVNSCRKEGFLRSKGEYICWFDSDDLMHPDKLLKTISVLKEDKRDCVIHNFNFFRSNEYVRMPFNDFGSDNDVLLGYISGDMILNFQSILWKRKAINIDYMREDLNYAEDVFFIANHLLLPNFNFKVISEALTHVRKHKVSLTSSFRSRPLHLINNEVYVRHYFWNLFKNKNNAFAPGSLKMYLKALKYYIHLQKYRLFMKKSITILRVVEFKYKVLLTRLIILSLVHLFFKKGITRYKNLVNGI